MNPLMKSVLNTLALEQIVDPMVSDIRIRTVFTSEKSLLNSQEIVDILRDKQKPPDAPDSMGKRILKVIRPTVIIKSKAFGDKVYAPYGEADDTTSSIWQNRVGLLVTTIALALIGTGFALGRMSKK